MGARALRLPTASPRTPAGRFGGRLPESALVLGGLLVLVNLGFVASTGAGDPYFSAVLTVALAAAGVVRMRRPHLPISAWYAAVAGLSPATALTESVLLRLLDGGSRSTSIAWLSLADNLFAVLSVVFAIRLIALFPEGRLEAAWQRRVLTPAWGLLAVPPIVAVSSAQVPVPSYFTAPGLPNPLQVLPVPVPLGVAQGAINLTFLAALVGPVMLLVRYRTAGTDTRRRIRWLTLPVALTVLFLLSNLLLPGGSQVAMWVAMLASSVAGDVAVTLGILAPPRADADRALRRVLVFGALWLAIAGTYVGLAALVGVTAGHDLPVTWAVGLALLAAVLFQPARTRLERLAERRVFGARSDPARAIATLGRTLAETFDLQSLLPRMARAVEDGLGVEWAAIRLDEGSGRAVSVTPIVLDGELLGVLECGPKRAGTWTDDDRAVLDTFAAQAALAVRNVRLTEHLASHAQDIAASRTRLVKAQETERRRIEQNIHDGVQQEMVALIGQLGLVRRRVNRAPDPGLAEFATDLALVQQALQRLLANLRELAAGVHPHLLTDHGLPAAVEALADRHPVPVALRIDPRVRAERLPEELEAAAYFTVAEALANSLKHSRAARLVIELTRPAGLLGIRVWDDGVGFETPSPDGRGLAHLEERASALGGELTVSSAPGDGTTVRAQFTIAATAGGTG